MINNSVMKCEICNNEKCGEFITINDKKYHLCCIEQLQNNWNELKKYIENELSSKYIHKYDILEKMQELEGNNE